MDNYDNGEGNDGNDGNDDDIDVYYDKHEGRVTLPKGWIFGKVPKGGHTAPESVKRVKSIKQILVKNKMEAERLSQCWQKTLPKKFKPSWMPGKNGVLWWPELPTSAFVAFNLQKIT